MKRALRFIISIHVQENIVYIEVGTIHNFRHPLRVLKVSSKDKRGITVTTLCDKIKHLILKKVRGRCSIIHLENKNEIAITVWFIPQKFEIHILNI